MHDISDSDMDLANNRGFERLNDEVRTGRDQLALRRHDLIDGGYAGPDHRHGDQQRHPVESDPRHPRRCTFLDLNSIRLKLCGDLGRRRWNELTLPAALWETHQGHATCLVCWFHSCR